MSSIQVCKSNVLDNHLFINWYHDPELCPECIRPGSLAKIDSIEIAGQTIPLFESESLVDGQEMLK